MLKSINMPTRMGEWIKEHIKKTIKAISEIIYENERENRLEAYKEEIKSMKANSEKLIDLKSEYGILQGDGISPMIACRTLQYNLEKDNFPKDQILMYMDDGLLFANTKTEIESLISRFKKM